MEVIRKNKIIKADMCIELEKNKIDKMSIKLKH